MYILRALLAATCFSPTHLSSVPQLPSSASAPASSPCSTHKLLPLLPTLDPRTTSYSLARGNTEIPTLGTVNRTLARNMSAALAADLQSV